MTSLFEKFYFPKFKNLKKKLIDVQMKIISILCILTNDIVCYRENQYDNYLKALYDRRFDGK